MAKVTKTAPKGWGTIAEYAKYTGVSRQSANRFVTNFNITKKGKWVEFAAIDLARAIDIDDSGKPLKVSKSNSDTVRLTKHRADVMATKSEVDALKLRELQGDLLRKEAIVNAAQSVLATVRKEIIALPHKLTPQVAACGGDEKEINKVLADGANDILIRLFELSKVGNADRKTNN